MKCIPFFVMFLWYSHAIMMYPSSSKKQILKKRDFEENYIPYRPPTNTTEKIDSNKQPNK